MNNNQIIDLKGSIFGKLTVLELMPSDGKGAKWKCKCDCGNENIFVRGCDLRRNKVMSCGCSRIKDLTGKRFGKLTPIKYIKNPKKSNGIMWLCKCDCGNEATVNGYDLQHKKVVSCGCYKKEYLIKKLSKSNRYELIDNNYYKVFDSKENFFLIDKEDFYLLKDKYWYIHRNGYVVNRTEDKKTKLLHREVMKISDKNAIVDHINGSSTINDNRKSNLRITEYNTNNWNRRPRKNTKTGIIGVQIEDGKYIARIMTNGIETRLGTFDSLEEAIETRKKAEIEQRGELSYFWSEFDQIKQGYIEMGELNLSICDETFIAENNAHNTIETNLKGWV